MASPSTSPYVPVSEAAYLAALTDKQLNRAIDENIIDEPLFDRVEGRRFARLASALIKFYFDYERMLTADARKEIIGLVTYRFQRRSDWPSILRLDQTTKAANWTVSLSELTVDLDQTVKAVQDRMSGLELAKEAVAQDEGILGGLPVFKGTRVPIDTVLAMKRAGANRVEINKHYPSITDAQIASAEIYRTIHPRRGRPAGLPVDLDGWKLLSSKPVARKK